MINYWVEGAKDDLKTAKSLFASKRHHHCLFFCHLFVEKIIKALVEELEKGRISACLDVTDPEPPAEDSPLRKLDNVLLTPHLAGCANSGLKEIGRSIVEEIVRFMNSNRLSNEIKLDRLAHLA